MWINKDGCDGGPEEKEHTIHNPVPLWVVVYHRDHIIIINIRELNDVANNLSPL